MNEFKFVLLLLPLILIVPLHCHCCSITTVTQLFEAWCSKHGKIYSSLEEKQRRLEIFKDNYEFVNQHNQKRNNSYTLALNAFADLSHDEFQASRLRPMKASSVGRNVKRHGPGEVVRDIPDKIDWSEKGVVTAVEDQGSCSSSYAFAAVGAIESINKITTGKLLCLSKQEVVDCDSAYNEGCEGGRVDNVYRFVIDNHGIDTDEEYPYRGYYWACHKKYVNRHYVTIDDYVDLPPENETMLQQAVAAQPVTAFICATGREFQLYDWGIFTGPCSTCLNHAVLIVGYDSIGGIDYWIVKNSWGLWGMNGYFLIKRNTGDSRGLCGINKLASYPIKTSPNPPKPPPLGPILCEVVSYCSSKETCCCSRTFLGLCLGWTCCPSSTVCYHQKCHPLEYSIYSTNTTTNPEDAENGREDVYQRKSPRKLGARSSFTNDT